MSSSPPSKAGPPPASDPHVETTHRLTEALVASENRMQRRIEILAEVVFETDGAGTIVFLNRAWSVLTGSAPGEAIGKPLADFVPPEDRPALLDLLARAETGRQHLCPQLRLSRGDGTVTWVQLSVVRLAPDGYVGVLRDISGEKTARDELEKVSMVARSTHDMVIITDQLGHTEWVNESFVRRTGYTLAEIVGRKPGWLLQSKETDPAVIERIRRGLRQGHAIHEEVINVTKSGEPYWVSIQINPVLGADGRIQRFIAVQRETTRRRIAEEQSRRRNTELEGRIQVHQEELAARNREMEGLLRAIPDMVLRQRSDGTVLHLQGEKCFAGATQHPFPSAGASLYSAAGILAISLQCGRAALESGTPVEDVVEIQQSRGVLYAEVRAVPSGPDEFVLIARDITARRALEKENAVELEKEREASDMKTRFISVISHEFRTPMASILGSIDILDGHLDRLAAEKRRELLERVRRALHRMTDMLDDVLTLNRMDRRGDRPKLAEINIRSFLQAIVDETRPLGTVNHTIEFIAPPSDPRFATDPEMLRHIVANLLSNAYRFSPAGGNVRLTLQYNDNGITATVEDQGIGVHPDDRRRIFEPFERGRNAGTIIGTGLGLNIVKRMVDALGGSLYLDSSLEKGSRFTVELPQLNLPA